MEPPVECVLVVEDEGLIRMSILDEMQDAGLRVYEAANADDALEILKRYPDIQAMFTDIDMPGTMNGVQLAHAVRMTYPKMKVLIASGYLKVPRSSMPEGVLYFSKPYDVMKVIEGMRSIGR